MCQERNKALPKVICIYVLDLDLCNFNIEYLHMKTILCVGVLLLLVCWFLNCQEALIRL